MESAASSEIKELVVPAIVADILRARGLTPDQIQQFVYPDYARDLFDPRLLSDMDKAVQRILAAAEQQERVVVYGDYDIDGITASAVLIEGLRVLGLEASSYIPDRFEEGYGINQPALEQLQRDGAQLVISVDCGITSVDEAKWAQQAGLDLIITDHHSVPELLPDAVAVINPKRPGDMYPFKELAGVGVAFKLIQALQQASGRPELGQEKWLLDLVALGTICDVVPLVSENRALASYGLKVLRRTRRAGLRALAGVGGIDIARITAHEVGFVLGPRMNAVGRLEHAACSLELVMTTDRRRAAEIADQLEAMNRQRRLDQATILAEAQAEADQYRDDSVLVLAGENWSHGVVGIVASKLAEKLRKPVLLAQIMGDTVKGSARSVPGFNMVEALRSQGALLSRFGGHFFAAGYTLPLDNLERLRRGLNDHFRKVLPDGVPATEQLAVDARWSDIGQLNDQLLDDLSLLEPHGNANARPMLALDGVTVRRVKKVGTTGQHLSIQLVDGLGRPLGCIGFGLAERHPELREGQIISVAGTLSTNVFQGRSSLQMVLSEIRYE